MEELENGNDQKKSGPSIELVATWVLLATALGVGFLLGKENHPTQVDVVLPATVVFDIPYDETHIYARSSWYSRGIVVPYDISIKYSFDGKAFSEFPTTNAGISFSGGGVDFPHLKVYDKKMKKLWVSIDSENTEWIGKTVNMTVNDQFDLIGDWED